MLIKFYSILYL